MKKKFLIATLSVVSIFIILPYLIPLPDHNYSDPKDIADPDGEFIQIENYEGFYIDTFGKPSDTDTTNPIPTNSIQSDPQGSLNSDEETIDGVEDPPMETVVFIHGFGSSTASWEPLMDQLDTEGYRMIAIDQKGFGMTEKTLDTGYSYEVQAEYIVGILDELGVEEAYFVGHSMGGNVISFIARDNPEMIKGLVYIAPAVGNNGNVLSVIAGYPPFSRYLQQILLRNIDISTIESNLSDAYGSSEPTEEMVQNYYKPLTIENWELSLIGIFRDSYKNKFDIEQVDKETPVLLIWGEKDSWVPPQENEAQFTDWFDDIEYIKINGVGHVPHEEEEEEVAGYLEEYLEGLRF